MNVYDFDKTIYSGDSTLDFYFYCLKRFPGIINCLPKQLLAGIKYKAGLIDKTKFKEDFYCFFLKINNHNELVFEFWDEHERKIKEWYKTIQLENDVIISASPHFLLAEICRRLKIRYLIASEVDMITGKYTGVNCYGEEKVRRFQELFDEPIDNFYSDSRSDQPLADLANNKYYCKGDTIVPW